MCCEHTAIILQSQLYQLLHSCAVYLLQLWQPTQPRRQGSTDWKMSRLKKPRYSVTTPLTSCRQAAQRLDACVVAATDVALECSKQQLLYRTTAELLSSLTRAELRCNTTRGCSSGLDQCLQQLQYDVSSELLRCQERQQAFDKARPVLPALPQCHCGCLQHCRAVRL
jgi:hypothetical protein